MKKLLTLFATLLISAFAFAQNPKLSYQAVVRDGQNKLVVEQPVTVTVNVLNAANESQFAQTLNATTNRNGLMSLEIGDETDAWKNINWSGAKIRTAMTFNDTEMVDTSIVNAVPFALYAEHVSDNFLSNYLDSAAVVRSIHDSLSSGSSAYHTHTNKALLDTYSQTNDNLTDAVAKKHTHANADILNAIEAPYSDADSVKLDGIQAGAEVNVNADWNATSGDALILNKPNIADTVNDILTNGNYITAATMDGRGYLTSDSAVITNMQNDIATNTANIFTNATNIAATASKEKADSTTLATRMDALENAAMNCIDVKYCISDTLSKYTTTEQLCSVVNNCDLSSNATLTNLSNLLQGLSNQMEAMNGKMDSLNHLVDSLSNQAPAQAFTCGSYTVSDHEGNTYNTLKIGNQCWTKENMRCTTSPSTHVSILDISSSGMSFSGKKAYYYDDIVFNSGNGFGLLYNWCAAVDTFNTTKEETSTSTATSDAPDVTFTGNRRGICPQGWHVPSDAEWNQLRAYMFTQSDYLCGSLFMDIAKSLASTEYWESDSHDCAVGNTLNENNKSGFTALPAGEHAVENFQYRDSGAFFWSATQTHPAYAYHLPIFSAGATVILNVNSKQFAHSVRCLRDGGVGGKAGTNETQAAQTLMTCENVLECVGDTLGKLNAKIEAQSEMIDSLTHLVDSLTNPASDTIPISQRIDGQPCPETPSVSDGTNTYATVAIGNQCWMAENMRRAAKTDGTPFQYGECYCPGKSTTEYCDSVEKYGYLYSWYAANEKNSYSPPSSIVRGICPEGWHIPTDNEWDTLITYVKGKTEYRCDITDKSTIGKALASKTGWFSDGAYEDCLVAKDQTANNATGFNAYPAGSYDSGFDDMGYYANFWSANGNAYQLYCGRKTFRKWDSVSLDASISVRCLKD